MKNNILKQFPLLQRKVNGQPLVYLDNASTTQKPLVVLQALQKFYTTSNANVHRGIHALSQEATEQYENVRAKVAKFINAKSEEIIFTKNATEALNCVAVSWGRKHIKKDDEIIVSALEHHANLVPWQELAKEKGAKLKVIPLTADYLLDLKVYKSLLSTKTKLVCVTAQSNVTGTLVPIKKIIALAHKFQAKVVVDAAQSAGHRPTNIKNIGCDFLAFSAHKMLGPTGVGVLYIKRTLMEEMVPYMYGGDMVETVGQEEATYHRGYMKFEAGTPNIADVIAFGSALDYLMDQDLEAVAVHDQELLAYAKKCFSKYPAVKIFSPTKIENCGGVLSFTVAGVHPHDIAAIFDQYGVAIRAGLHCAEPLVHRLGVSTTARLSFYLYNTKHDVDVAEKALKKVFEIFKIKN